jgi:hypothetical protein
MSLRRILRRSFSAVAVGSLGLLILLIGFWVADHETTTSREIDLTVPNFSSTGGTIWGAQLFGGRIHLGIYGTHLEKCAFRLDARADSGWSLGFYSEFIVSGAGGNLHKTSGGFAWGYVRDRPSDELFESARIFMFPIAWAVVLLAALPIVESIQLFRGRRRVLRRRARRCEVCGYDIRASPEICPECGCRVTVPN